MKKNNKKTAWTILGVVIGLIVIAIGAISTIPGNYSFNEFWNLVFTKLFNIDAFFGAFLPIIKKIPESIEMTFIAMILGLLLGLFLAIVKINKVPVLNQIRAVFVSFIRGTPILVQLMLTYTGIPLVLKAINMNYGTEFNVNAFPAMVFVIVAFFINEGAYSSETIRAAIESVDKGQIEAARALGMTELQVFMRVTLPEAAKVAIAPLGNALLGLLKSTSLAFSAGVTEMYAQAQIIGGSTFRVFETMFALALVYWPLCIVLEFLMRALEKKLQVTMPDDRRKIRTSNLFAKNPFDQNNVKGESK